MRGGVPGERITPEPITDREDLMQAIAGGSVRLVRQVATILALEGEEREMDRLGLLADRYTAIPTNLIDEIIDHLEHPKPRDKARHLATRLRALSPND